MRTLNSALSTEIPFDPMPCLLGILEEVVQDNYLKEAANRAMFQARRLILLHWISQTAPTDLDRSHRYGV